MPPAHVSWCADRYRSYNPDENSYRSYSGQQRPISTPRRTPASDRPRWSLSG
ncbi:BA14K family protein [Mesorhizobium australicum]